MKEKSWLERTELLIGAQKVENLNSSHVLVVGMGGVGSFAAEFVARAGVGTLTIVDGDTVHPTNRNRQLPALVSTQDKYKVEIMANRLKDINPEIKINVVNAFVTPEKVDELIALKPDFMIDAIDSIQPKLTFIQQALKHQIPFVSSMGAGGKLDPTQLKVVDISKTIQCPFAHHVRKKLKEVGIRTGFQVVYSPEKVIKESLMYTDGTNFKKSAYGTISYLPATFGAVCSSVAIRYLMEKS